MAEKRKVAVVVEASHASASSADGCQQQGGSQPFNFDQFQGNFYNANDPQQQQQQQQQRSGGEQNNNSADGGLQNDESSDYVTSYQVRKTSIVEGVTTEQLIMEHRKSLCQVSAGHVSDFTELNGVTLSRRHTISAEEYDEKKSEELSNVLQSYSFEN